MSTVSGSGGGNKLGMGLGALLNMQKANIEKQDQKPVQEIDVSLIDNNPDQPRKNFEAEAIISLADSIRQYGVLQPILLRKADGKRYQIIAGERRFRAAKYLGLEQIPAIIKDVGTEESFIAAMVENIQRSDLSIIEEAEGYLFLQNTFNITQSDIGIRVGKHRSHIANMLRLANLPQEVKNYISENKISYSHVKVVAGRKDAMKLLKACHEDSLTVRQLEALINTADTNTVESDKTHKNLKVKQTQTEDQFEHQLKLIEEDFSSKLGIRVKFSKSSAKHSYDINISFKDREKLEAMLKVLISDGSRN